MTPATPTTPTMPASSRSGALSGACDDGSLRTPSPHLGPKPPHPRAERAAATARAARPSAKWRAWSWTRWWPTSWGAAATAATPAPWACCASDAAAASPRTLGEPDREPLSTSFDAEALAALGGAGAAPTQAERPPSPAAVRGSPANVLKVGELALVALVRLGAPDPCEAGQAEEPRASVEDRQDTRDVDVACAAAAAMATPEAPPEAAPPSLPAPPTPPQDATPVEPTSQPIPIPPARAQPTQVSPPTPRAPRWRRLSPRAEAILRELQRKHDWRGQTILVPEPARTRSGRIDYATVVGFHRGLPVPKPLLDWADDDVDSPFGDAGPRVRIVPASEMPPDAEPGVVWCSSLRAVQTPRSDRSPSCLSCSCSPHPNEENLNANVNATARGRGGGDGPIPKQQRKPSASSPSGAGVQPNPHAHAAGAHGSGASPGGVVSTGKSAKKRPRGRASRG